MFGKSENEKWTEESIANLDWNIDSNRKWTEEWIDYLDGHVDSNQEWTEEWVDYLETEVKELRKEVATLKAQLKSLKSGMPQDSRAELQKLFAQAVNECLGGKAKKKALSYQNVEKS